ncbi:S-layer homology domain-containing protein [Cytobacillus massiliigabonensis]|uniref:S-layer homology domain-containing protein n=1 Tax=Cytobacillus massiliigabonensis TaxID=1871011 RepID=UPI000C82195C|nr:S-layer homology domain-containing protein [Cytobacillus massiliigabonensis]
MRKKLSGLAAIILLVQVMSFGFAGSPAEAASSTINKQFKVSPGVDYKNIKLTNSSVKQSINLMEVNLADSYTTLEVGIPNPVSKLATTTKAAQANSYDGHRVVGAINGSFFDMTTKLPMYLLAKDNGIVNGGLISEGKDKYVSEPIAFGILNNGQAEIDTYQFKNTLTFNGKKFELSGFNRMRDANEAIIYTPGYGNGYTNTNSYGVEYIITSDTKINKPIQFGDILSGKVRAIRQYGDKTNTLVRENEFVLSVNGTKWMDQLQAMKVGDAVQVQVNIDSKWQNSKYMMASGPMLVKDGKVFLTIDPNSPRAKEKAPRTAVAIDKTKKKVFFVTVDGRQPGFSTGMSLSEFAQYLVSLGVDRALNLDGGGSTAMAVRNYGNAQVSLVNKPSGGSERLVSTTLQAISTAPLGQPSILSISQKTAGKVMVGSSVAVNTNYVLDQYYNPLSVDPKQLALTVSNNVGEMTGNQFTAKQKGEGMITGKYGNAVKNLPITVVDTIDQFSVAPTSLKLAAGQTKALTTAGKDSAGKAIIYDKSQVKWSVSGNIGTITKDGLFTAGSETATGKITATIGKSSKSIPVEVNGASTPTPDNGTFKDVNSKYWAYKEIMYLADKGIISGYPTGEFKPGDQLTRSHAAILLARALNLNTANIKDPGFKDVPQTHRYYSIIASVANAGIMGGKEGNLFDPEGKLTRAQMAGILQNAYKLQGMPSKDFADVKPSYWAYRAIGALAYNEITTGYPDNTFKPGDTVTRAQYSAFLYRILTK